MIVTLDEMRRLTLPEGLVPAASGDSFDVSFDAETDAIIFRRLSGREDWLDVMFSCPAAMDDLPLRAEEFAKRRGL